MCWKILSSSSQPLVVDIRHTSLNLVILPLIPANLLHILIRIKFSFASVFTRFDPLVLETTRIGPPVLDPANLAYDSSISLGLYAARNGSSFATWNRRCPNIDSSCISTSFVSNRLKWKGYCYCEINCSWSGYLGISIVHGLVLSNLTLCWSSCFQSLFNFVISSSFFSTPRRWARRGERDVKRFQVPLPVMASVYVCGNTTHLVQCKLSVFSSTVSGIGLASLFLNT